MRNSTVPPEADPSTYEIVMWLLPLGGKIEHCWLHDRDHKVAELFRSACGQLYRKRSALTRKATKNRCKRCITVARMHGMDV